MFPVVLNKLNSKNVNGKLSTGYTASFGVLQLDYLVFFFFDQYVDDLPNDLASPCRPSANPHPPPPNGSSLSSWLKPAC